MNAELAVLGAAVLGFVGREAMAIAAGIKDQDNGSPSKLDLGYYFSRPKNLLLLLTNACGTGILFIARNEVLSLTKSIPVVSEYLGEGTPVLVGGMIGFTGAHILRWAKTKLGTNEQP